MYVVEFSIGYNIKDSIFDKVGSFEVMTEIFFSTDWHDGQAEVEAGYSF